MCLGIPGRIEAVTDVAAKLARVDVLGVKREVNIACVLQDGDHPDDCVGAWVLVHVGFAMSRIDEDEAHMSLQLLRDLGEFVQEVDTIRTGPAR
ncbi:hydrogenase 2 accessory protein [Paraburkholderia ribeironis]|uniref:Hydrogenase 2 accessory protein n=1 Tax=Paraburkholderia ribeironis TaxID=1247936 RepID=A0A1N7RSY5_9BURK|nr:HypC/HybG/HupF family hydrogenase formation chaperone [Paraburkholderia ribeironis]SIT38223.1 hydrogenase 2 accessory protein [Paraburkholderia ribeironis]